MPKFVANIDLTQQELQNAKIHILAADPGSPAQGQIYYNSVSKTLKFYTGSAWVTLGTLDQITAPAGDLSLNTHKITNLVDPSGAQDAATKAYVDAIQQGIYWKAAVRAATTANGTLATAFANGQVIDGVTLATGDRILLKNQTSGGENGIYVVAASGAPARATDVDVAAEILQAACWVEEGTANADTAWVNTTNAPITLGTTATVWVKFASAVAAVLAKYATSVGDGAATSIVVTHSLGTTDVQVFVFRVASPFDQVFPDIQITNTTQVTLVFASAPSSGQYRCVVVG